MFLGGFAGFSFGFWLLACFEEAFAARPVGKKPSPETPPPEVWSRVDGFDDFSAWNPSEGFGHAQGLAGWGNNEFQYYHPNPFNAGLVETSAATGCSQDLCGARMSLRVVSNRKLMLEGMTATVGHTETPVTCEEYCMSVVKDAVDWLMRDCFDRCQEGRSIVSAKLVSNTAIQPKNESGHCTKYRISFDFIPGPDGTCQWPAIWLLPDSQDTSSSGLGTYGHWPFSGELDIFETQNNYRRKFMTMHYGDVSGNHVAAGGTSRYGGGSAHFQFEWATDYIAWFQDGRQVQRFDKWAAGDESRNAIDFPAPFDQPFKLIVNFAMGGGLTGVNDYQKCIDYLEGVNGGVAEFTLDNFLVEGTGCA